ncbi:hypothetical protein LROSL3_0618 [Furfurilactobacillus rossiae]|jgi:hypothetical protein|nr:hypothetical protein LROSL2_0617 [Furfurilactobacillus rossiae]QLE68400.1 hypothetical protein LROSL3_0618 [Furfurilactobacillus rossiae]
MGARFVFGEIFRGIGLEHGFRLRLAAFETDCGTGSGRKCTVFHLAEKPRERPSHFDRP